MIVDEHCRTADPNVYAIGECAELGGRVYGLVAPGYAMAEVVADRLARRRTPFPGADTSTKLKLLGVDVASFGETSGPLDVTFTDPVTKVYAKLVLSDDAQTLLGGVLVGDASAYPTLRACLGGPLPGPPLTLLAPARDGAAPSLPGGAQVCSCNAVTKGTIVAAIAEQGCADVAAVKACTRAGTTCGSCVPLLKQLLAEAGVALPRALCEHFDLNRQELFDIVRVRGIRTFSRLVAEHGRGRGCDICKPAVASILAATGGGYILDGEQAALQDTNDHFLANIQRNGTYSVVPRIPGGEITPEKLIVIGEVARDFGLYTKITGGQRIDLFGARVEQLPQIWRRLVDAGFESGHAYGKALRTVKSCVGTTWCRYGVQDSVGLAIALELRYRGLRSPHKLKSAVSGCARECAEARSKDFGIIATETGWNLYVGGNGGFRPRHADLFLTDLSTEELVRYVDRFLMFYIRTADRLQRTAAWIEALDGGLDYLRRVIVDDSLGIAADLDAAMARARRRLRGRVAVPRGRSGPAAPVRLLRQRARHPGPDHRLRRRARSTDPGPRAGAAGDASMSPAWTPICPYTDLEPERGVAALVDGVQVALFRTHDGALYAMDNVDPISRAGVLSRGIVGTRGDAPTVASPMHKQVYDLRTRRLPRRPRCHRAHLPGALRGRPG